MVQTNNMECNKDEATRAKEIAENKFIAKDIAGAKKFALKAESLYPGIEGVSQMLAIFDVYIAADIKINGEPDWYGILGVSSQDDDEMMKRKYRKLALMLHPDKNKSIGAEGAFKHVAEAWKFLSDKEKRYAYDCKRNSWAAYKNSQACNVPKTDFTTNMNTPMNYTQKHVTPTQNASAQAQRTERAGPVKRGSSTVPPSSSHGSASGTFWTVCLRCMLQYEYQRTYVNCSLLCPICHRSYLAVEVEHPHRSSALWSYSQQKQKLNQKSGWAFSRTGYAAFMTQKAFKKVDKEQEEHFRKKNARTSESSPGNASKLQRVSQTRGVKVTYQINGDGKEWNMGKLHRRKLDDDIIGTTQFSSPKIQSPFNEKSKNRTCKNVSQEIKSH